MLYKKSLFLCLYTVLICLAGFAAILYLSDPLQIWHKPWFRTNTFNTNMRLQNRGIINNYSFDSIISGTSMLENTSAQEASQRLGGSWVNLSISAGTFSERALILNYMLKHKTIKQIIYSFDLYPEAAIADDNGTYPQHTYSFLYDDNPYNDYKIYMSDHFLECIFTFSGKKKCIGIKADTDAPNRWDNSERMLLLGGFDKWLQHKNINPDKFRIIQEKYTLINQAPQSIPTDKIKQAQENICRYIFELARQNPQTEFNIVIPPYSRLYHALNAQSNNLEFDYYQQIIPFLVTKSQNIKNLKVYGFDDMDYPDQIANYVDLSHYGPDMNSYMLQSIKQDKHRLTNENIKHYMNKTVSLCRQYPLQPFINKIKNAK